MSRDGRGGETAVFGSGLRSSPAHLCLTPLRPASYPCGMPAKQRLDLLVAGRGLAPDRRRAQAAIMAGDVLVNGERVVRQAASVPAATMNSTAASVRRRMAFLRFPRV